ncbi:MAG TPA: histidine kinase dimerization/phosphoacceptor domain -containing protein [Vicinamibacteria bacterium]|nr:histidine kinase dimerization/phosphoacceptor domain -containing protein [Vicinamibacteria bacterium]
MDWDAEIELRVQARTAQLEAALHDRDLLLEEVHHRVKNNLQVISSLISMQARAAGASAGRDALEECRTRVQTIALIHEKLNQSQQFARLPFSDYVRDLAHDIFNATCVSPCRISLELAVDTVTLPVDKATRCGLLLNELITNALRHAFRDGRAGTVRVEVSSVGTGLRLAVRDDGIGLPEGLDLARSSSLGLQIVHTLVKQLGARLEIEVAGGTCVRITVPVEE